MRVLHVCTGNICRSPMAERLMAAEFAAAFPGQAVVDVRGAGTYGGHQGEPMHHHAAQVLGERSVDASGFSSTWLREPQIAWAELVLTATAEHRSEVLRLEPRALRRTFTLRELARLAGHVSPDELAPGLAGRPAARAHPAGGRAAGRAPGGLAPGRRHRGPLR